MHGVAMAQGYPCGAVSLSAAVLRVVSSYAWVSAAVVACCDERSLLPCQRLNDRLLVHCGPSLSSGLPAALADERADVRFP